MVGKGVRERGRRIFYFNAEAQRRRGRKERRVERRGGIGGIVDFGLLRASASLR
jgi:hypothetical protein